MNEETLLVLQVGIDAGQPLRLEDCATLICEVWRLKTALIGKTLEVEYWQKNYDDLAAELNGATQANESLRRENEWLKSTSGLARCYFENTWSNCAVRRCKHEHGVGT